MNNMTVRFNSEEETNMMISFLQENDDLLQKFKNDNNGILQSQLNVVFSYALEHQVPSELRKNFLNMQMEEIAPYVWKLGCWMSFASDYRKNLDPTIFINDEEFRLVVHPTGRGHEIQVTPDGMMVERGLNMAWKLLQRHKELNENLFHQLVMRWKLFKAKQKKKITG